MPQHIVLLRGINLVRRNRIAMTELRTLLEAEGFTEVRTYLQSGNVVLGRTSSADQVAKEVNVLIKTRFALDIAVIVRSREQLTQVVNRNPLAKVASDPKRHLVTFLSSELSPAIIDKLHSVAAPSEQFVVSEREIYSWHPVGIGRSPLWERLSGKALGVSATSRNWTTVTALVAMAADSATLR